MALARTALQAVPAPTNNATTDGITFDANQNKFTQKIERLYWEKFGISQEISELYYSFRSNYRVISSVAVGYAGTQKTSGEPGTLVNNGIVSKCVSNFIVRGDGPVCIIYKGDDFNKRQCNVQIDRTNETQVNAVCALGPRANIGRNSEFCGLTFCEGNLFPSIPRKVNKIMAQRFRDYKHFCEYQTAIRDWINLIAKQNKMLVIACNAAQYVTGFIISKPRLV